MEVDTSADEVECFTECAERIPVTSNEYLLSYDDACSRQINFAAKAGVKEFSIFYTPEHARTAIPKAPYKLKDELEKLNLHADITLCKHTRQGKLLLKTTNAKTAELLGNITSILNVKVFPEVHLDNITSKFILREIPINEELSRLANDLEEKNGIIVNNIRRFNVKAKKEPSETVLVTCYGENLPNEVKICMSVVKIKRFFDSPRQCKSCFKFTHSQLKCKVEDRRCRTCTDKHEADSTCPNTQNPTCVNCLGKHPADSRECPTRKEEERFLKFKCENHLSFSEARRRFADNNSNSYTKVINSAQESQNKEMQEMITSTIQKAISPLEQKLKTIQANNPGENLESQKMLNTCLKGIQDLTIQVSLLTNLVTQLVHATTMPLCNEASTSPTRKVKQKTMQNATKDNPNFTKLRNANISDTNKSISNFARSNENDPGGGGAQ